MALKTVLEEDFLLCSLLGVEKGFSLVRMPFDNLGIDLKTRIKADNPITIQCKADQLRVFPAFEGGDWVTRATSTSGIVQQLERGEWSDELEEMADNEDQELEDSVKIRDWLDSLGMTGERAPRLGQVHVLVTGPEHLIIGRDARSFLEYVEHETTCESSSMSADNTQFKSSLVRTYKCDEGNDKLSCMLLAETFPSELVLASRVIRPNDKYNIENRIDLDDLDHPRNGLLLFAPLKRAFDNYQLAFLYDERCDAFRLKLCDTSLRNKRLFDQLDKNQQSILLGDQHLPKRWEKQGPRFLVGRNFDLQTTFGDRDGRALYFTSLERPYTSVA